MVTNAQNDLRNELGPDFPDLDVQDLNPRNFVKKHLLDGIDGDQQDEKPVSSTVDANGSRPLAAGERPPYDPEST